MLTDYFSCYGLNKSTPFHEDKNSQKLQDCQYNQSFWVFDINDY